MCALWWRPEYDEKNKRLCMACHWFEVKLMSGMHLLKYCFQTNVTCLCLQYLVLFFICVQFLPSSFSIFFYIQIKVPVKRILDWIEKINIIQICSLVLFTLHKNLIWFSNPIFRNDCLHKKKKSDLTFRLHYKKINKTLLLDTRQILISFLKSSLILTIQTIKTSKIFC